MDFGQRHERCSVFSQTFVWVLPSSNRLIGVVCLSTPVWSDFFFSPEAVTTRGLNLSCIWIPRQEKSQSQSPLLRWTFLHILCMLYWRDRCMSLHRNATLWYQNLVILCYLSLTGKKKTQGLDEGIQGIPQKGEGASRTTGQQNENNLWFFLQCLHILDTHHVPGMLLLSSVAEVQTSKRPSFSSIAKWM